MVIPVIFALPFTSSAAFGFVIPIPTRPLKSVIPCVPSCLVLRVLYISAVSGAPNEPADPLGGFTVNPVLLPGLKLLKLPFPSVPPLTHNPPRASLVLKMNGVPFI